MTSNERAAFEGEIEDLADEYCEDDLTDCIWEVSAAIARIEDRYGAKPGEGFDYYMKVM